MIIVEGATATTKAAPETETRVNPTKMVAMQISKEGHRATMILARMDAVIRMGARTDYPITEEAMEGKTAEMIEATHLMGAVRQATAHEKATVETMGIIMTAAIETKVTTISAVIKTITIEKIPPLMTVQIMTRRTGAQTAVVARVMAEISRILEAMITRHQRIRMDKTDQMAEGTIETIKMEKGIIATDLRLISERATT